MKKLYILLLLCALLLISGCSQESHASENTVVDNFLEAYMAQDFAEAEQYIASDSKESFTSLQSLIVNKEINDLVIRKMTAIKYSVISSDLKDQNGTMVIRIIYPNAGGAFMNAIGVMYVDASEGKLIKDSPETITRYIHSLLLTHLDQDLETMDREREVELVKENQEWRIVMTEEFKNAISANMMNAIEELEIMGVQF